MSSFAISEPTITDYHRAAQQIRTAIHYSRVGEPAPAQRRLQAAMLVVDGRGEEYLRDAQPDVCGHEARYAMRHALQLLGTEIELATVGFDAASEVDR